MGRWESKQLLSFLIGSSNNVEQYILNLQICIGTFNIRSKKGLIMTQSFSKSKIIDHLYRFNIKMPFQQIKRSAP